MTQNGIYGYVVTAATPMCWGVSQGHQMLRLKRALRKEVDDRSTKEGQRLAYTRHLRRLCAPFFWNESNAVRFPQSAYFEPK